MTTATSESLFIKKLDPSTLFKKEASIARMPDDDRKWPEVVLSELHKQLPFMSGMDVSLNFTRIQPEAGYGFGYALVRGQKNAVNLAPKHENQMVKIPIVVADRHLEPFHVFNFEGKTIPLTRGRFEEALENPRVFAGVDKMPKTQKSLIDQLYPPYQQRQGFGRTGEGAGMLGAATGMGKMASIMDPHSKTQQGLDLLGLPSTRDFNRKAIATKNVNDALARVKAKRGIKQAEAPAIVQNPMNTMSPNELKRLATLKQYEGIDRARAQMSSKDKNRQTLDNMAFSAGAGGLLQGGMALAGAHRAGNALSAANLGKAGLRGAATGAALSLAGQGYKALKGKLRERDRGKEKYNQYLGQNKMATAEDIPNLRASDSADINCGNCNYYGSSTEKSAGVCNKYTADVNEKMVCDSWEVSASSSDKLANYNKYLMGAKL